jgi:hypothetical protein
LFVKITKDFYVKISVKGRGFRQEIFLVRKEIVNIFSWLFLLAIVGTPYTFFKETKG